LNKEAIVMKFSAHSMFLE